MARYGEASAVGYEKDRVSRYAIPGAAVAIGANSVKSAIKPNPARMYDTALEKLRNADVSMDSAVREMRRNKMPTGRELLNPKSHVKYIKARSAARKRFDAAQAQTQISAAQWRQTKQSAPKMMMRNSRIKRGAVGTAVAGAGVLEGLRRRKAYNNAVR